MTSLHMYDKMSASSTSSIGSKCEKYNMKQFILAAQEYNKTKCDETASLLSRYLQLLSVTQDLYTFDPHNSVAVQFFISLHELMESLDHNSHLIWCSINVLQHACKNPGMHKALINTYQFLPILSRLLGEHLMREKKIKLLTLMQELTYGIKIYWQVSHMPNLIQILTKWIESGDESIVVLSLGVLLNLCYKNLPVTYTLMRTVNTKQFLRTVISTKTPATEIYVCKLLIILEHVNGEIPDDAIINFVKVTFGTVVEAFKANDLVRMRHIVEFFIDVKNQSNQNHAITNFNYQPEVLRILSEIETSVNTNSEEMENYNTVNECTGLLIDFLNSLLELKIVDLLPVHYKIVSLVLNYVTNEIIAPKALNLLKTILTYPENSSHDMLKIVLEKLPVFIQMFKNNHSQSSTFTENCEKLCAILQLLRALTCCRDIRDKVVDQLSDDSMKELLVFMLKDEEVLKCSNVDEGVELCMRTLVLVSELSQCDNFWYDIYQQVMKQRQVHILLAKASNAEAKEVKVLLFELTGTKKFPKNEVASAMCDLQPNYNQNIVNNKGTGDVGGYAVLTLAQKTQLDNLIETFKEAIATNQVSNIGMSEVMELYEYKMASMAHTEQAYNSGLDSANKIVIHLQHRVAQMSAELSKLHQLLFHTQQCQEQAQKQLNTASDTIQKITARLTKEEIKYKELTRAIKEKEIELQDNQKIILQLEHKQQEMILANKALTKKYETQCEKNRALVSGAEKLENCVNDLTKQIQDKNENISKYNIRIEQMSQEIKELEELRRMNESTIVCKEKELQQAIQNLADCQKILETITKLTTSRS